MNFDPCLSFSENLANMNEIAILGLLVGLILTGLLGRLVFRALKEFFGSTVGAAILTVVVVVLLLIVCSPDSAERTEQRKKYCEKAF